MNEEGFGMSRRWVINDRIFIFGVNNPFKHGLSKRQTNTYCTLHCDEILIHR